MKNVIYGVFFFLTGAVITIFVVFVVVEPFFPPGLPKNFSSAPIQITCASEEPLAIHAKFFINSKEGWSLIILGRNYIDMYISLSQSAGGKRKNTDWANLGNSEWVNVQTLNKEWLEYFSGANKLFLFPEKLFFRRCFNRGLEANAI